MQLSPLKVLKTFNAMIEPGSVHHGIKVVDKIDSGAFASVWAGMDTVTQIPVALKVIPKSVLCDTKRIAAYRREHLIMRKADHPFLVEFYFDFELETEHVLVMEYVPNGNLFDLIIAHGSLPENVARKYFCELVIALEYIHTTLKVIHRDLKAENVLLDENSHIRVIDFGLSNMLSDQSETFSTPCGSPGYSSPELVVSGQYTKAADIWALGVILYAMVVGRLPFESDDVGTLLQRIATSEPEYPPTLSPSLVELLKGMLRKCPQRRVTIDEIKAHEWFSMTEYQTMSRVSKVTGLDKEIINKMIFEYDIDSTSVMAEVQEGKVNRNTCLYRELKKRAVVAVMSDVIAGRSLGQTGRRRTDDMRVRSPSLNFTPYMTKASPSLNLASYAMSSEDESKPVSPTATGRPPKPEAKARAPGRRLPVVRIAARKSGRRSFDRRTYAHAWEHGGT